MYSVLMLKCWHDGDSVESFPMLEKFTEWANWFLPMFKKQDEAKQQGRINIQVKGDVIFNNPQIIIADVETLKRFLKNN